MQSATPAKPLADRAAAARQNDQRSVRHQAGVRERYRLVRDLGPAKLEDVLGRIPPHPGELESLPFDLRDGKLIGELEKDLIPHVLDHDSQGQNGHATCSDGKGSVERKRSTT